MPKGEYDRKPKKWTNKEIASMFLYQSTNQLSDNAIRKKYGITTYQLRKWKNQRTPAQNSGNNMLIQNSHTGVELAKDKYDIELLEKKKEVLNEIVKSMLFLIPKEEDLNKLSNALKAITDIETRDKQLETDTANRNIFANYLEEQSKSFQTIKILMERKGSYDEAEVVEE